LASSVKLAVPPHSEFAIARQISIGLLEDGEIHGDDDFWLDSQIISQGPPL
jgi:hypothetical protein